MGMFNAAYAKAIFTPKHPEKCLNTNGKCEKPLPQMRSSWEMKFANFCDIEENVLGWPPHGRRLCDHETPPSNSLTS